MPAPINIRSLQSKNGVTIRTRKGTSVFNETSPQNSQSFGVDNAVAGAAGSNFLAAPGAGFCWVITSLVVSTDAIGGQGVRVAFTGNLAVVFNSVNSTTAPPPGAVAVINSPTAMAANSVFGFSSTMVGTGTAHISISGTAYKATVGTVFNVQTAQVIATPIDSDPAADLG